VKIAVFGVVVNACLCLSLMQVWGHVGIALATGITVWVNAFQYIYLLKKQGEFSLDGLFKYRFIRIIFSAVLMGLFLLGGDYIYSVQFGDWIRLSGFWAFLLLSVLIGGGILIYFTSLILTKGILWREIKVFFSMKKRRKV